VLKGVRGRLEGWIAREKKPDESSGLSAWINA
jgi:hypothetical protein